MLSIRVDGARGLRADLKRCGDDLGDLKDAHARAAALVAAAASARAPRKSGRLAGSGRGNRAAARSTVLFGGATVPYAAPIHYGWPARDIEAHPFASDAATGTEHIWVPMFRAEMDQIVQRNMESLY